MKGGPLLAPAHLARGAAALGDGRATGAFHHLWPVFDEHCTGISSLHALVRPARSGRGRRHERTSRAGGDCYRRARGGRARSRPADPRGRPCLRAGRCWPSDEEPRRSSRRRSTSDLDGLSVSAGQDPVLVRSLAAPAATQRRLTGSAARGDRAVRRARRDALERARAAGAARHRREARPPHTRRPRPAHRPGASDRPARGRRACPTARSASGCSSRIARSARTSTGSSPSSRSPRARSCATPRGGCTRTKKQSFDSREAGRAGDDRAL